MSKLTKANEVDKPNEGPKRWYRVSSGSWAGYLRLSKEMAGKYRKAGWSVIAALPCWAAGQTASDR